MQIKWKSNWEETQQHFLEWWKHDGLVLGMWGHGYITPGVQRGDLLKASEPDSFEAYHTDPAVVSARWYKTMSQSLFPADTLPIIRPSMGTVELAAYLGTGVLFKKDNIWYDDLGSDLDSWPKLSFDAENICFRRIEATIRSIKEWADGNCLIGFPCISPNMDVLAELRGTGALMMDFFDRPDWIKEKLVEIDELYMAVYDRLYELIKQPDGSSAFHSFMIWGPGKTTQLQGDTAAMLSADMFREFMVPGFTRIAEWTDNSLFHVDGPDMIKHVDALLEIDALDAIEFTPGPSVPEGGDPHWFDMYRRILDAGKSLQAVWVKPDEIVPLLNAVGTHGVYLMVDCQDADEMTRVTEKTKQAMGLK